VRPTRKLQATRPDLTTVKRHSLTPSHPRRSAPIRAPSPESLARGRVVVASYFVSRRPATIPHGSWDRGVWSTVGQPMDINSAASSASRSNRR
jgi:hypothetical protein